MNATDDRPAGEYRPASTNGWTPLHLAALSGRAKAAAVLLDHRADVNAADQRGKHTPLHLAAWAGDADLVRLLLARKADPGAKDAMDRTPLDLATERGHGGVISLLKECGLRRGPVSGRGHYVRSTRSPSPAMSPSWVV